ncbi:MAG: IPT/TIG domain-containing protein [Treponema sp.]|nr:IPT/TIG domain-containing protein [Treponema sp.]MBQ7881619.1 IPT/TIG domain-containing protein [Treponema sp.]
MSKIIKNFTILFRKYPIFRVFSVVVFILLVVGLFSLINYRSRKVPIITSITPPVGAPGDIMIISGENFGPTRNTSDYVEVSGSKITASGYLAWQDTLIKIILPANVQDGLVIVSTKSGSSEPGFFANKAGIPVEVPPDTKTSLPIITAINSEKSTIGSLLIITGINFGTIRNNSTVYFTANRDNKDNNAVFLSANEDNFDYEYWSDSEIHLRIPEGASSGQLYVQTEKGISNYFNLNLKSPIGSKSYTGKKTYLIQLTEDIENINSKVNTTLSLRVPYPPTTASQSLAKLTECSPEPVFERYQNTIIHQLELSKSSALQTKFNQNYVIEEHTVHTKINPKAVKPFSEKTRVLYTAYTDSNRLINCEDEDYIKLAKQIVKKETNPYLQAKLIYDYIIDNFQLEESLRPNGSSAKDLILNKKGDAFDFAILYTTLLRICKIPSITVSGILVDSDLKCNNHWWNEFYIENFGWVPVDTVLGKGLEYKSFRPIENTKDFYFGNIDSQHITFSRGWNELKPSLTNSKIVYRERTYALQSIWEESSTGIVNYSSLWNDPIVVGIY